MDKEKVKKTLKKLDKQIKDLEPLVEKSKDVYFHFSHQLSDLKDIIM